jgi:hypothetical protein
VDHEETLQKVGSAVYQDLLKALESARTKLAIAIAAETKATPLERWNYYLETADQMRRCLKQLRALPRSNIRSQADWIEALDNLRQIPQRPDPKSRQEEANQLCQRLRAVLAQLGQPGA